MLALQVSSYLQHLPKIIRLEHAFSKEVIDIDQWRGSGVNY